MNIRECTAIIIEKDKEFLVARNIATGNLVWSNSPYDAWRTRIREKAAMVAEKVNGNTVLFNPIAGVLKMCDFGGRYHGNRCEGKLYESDGESIVNYCNSRCDVENVSNHC